MQMCQWAMKRQEVKMLSLRLSPEEVFCEAVEVIDRIVASPKEVDTLLHALWDTLLSDYLDLTDGATPADAERAAACVYYAAIAALIYCSYAGYKYGIVRKLISSGVCKTCSKGRSIQRARVETTAEHTIPITIDPATDFFNKSLF